MFYYSIPTTSFVYINHLHLFIHLPIQTQSASKPTIHLFIHQKTPSNYYFTCPSIYLLIHPCMHPAIFYPSIQPSISPSIHPSIHPSSNACIQSFSKVFVHPPIYLRPYPIMHTCFHEFTYSFNHAFKPSHTHLPNP